MCTRELINCLRADFQSYSQAMDIMRDRLKELTKDWAENAEVEVAGDWQNIISVKTKFKVTDTKTGQVLEIPGSILRKNPKTITREEIIRDGK